MKAERPLSSEVEPKLKRRNYFLNNTKKTSKYMSTATKFRPGVLHGDEVTELLNYANENNFALPAVNVIGTDSVNAVLETARDLNSPVIIQFSNGGASFSLVRDCLMKDRKQLLWVASLVLCTFIPWQKPMV